VSLKINIRYVLCATRILIEQPTASEADNHGLS